MKKLCAIAWFFIWAQKPIGPNNTMIAIFSRAYATQIACQVDRAKVIQAGEHVTACFNGDR